MARTRTHTPQITTDLARALGVAGAQRCVLTLEVGELPRFEVTFSPRRAILDAPDIESAVSALPPDAAARILRTPLKLRLYAHPLEGSDE